MNIEAFVITLDRATERKAQVARIKEMSPVACHEVSAVDGSLLSAEERNRWVRSRLFRPHYPFRLRDGEIGVFLSHRLAWQQIVDRDLDAGLILEDDVELDNTVFQAGFRLAVSQLKPNQYYKFSIRSQRSSTAASSQAAVVASQPLVVPLGAPAQLVGRAAALHLLAVTERFDRPVDSFMQLSWLTNVENIVIQPSGVTEVSHRLGGSTIQVKKRPAAETLYRNLVRPIYRSQIRLMAAYNALEKTAKGSQQARLPDRQCA